MRVPAKGPLAGTAWQTRENACGDMATGTPRSGAVQGIKSKRAALQARLASGRRTPRASLLAWAALPSRARGGSPRNLLSFGVPALKRLGGAEGDRLAAFQLQDGRKVIGGTPARIDACLGKTGILRK